MEEVFEQLRCNKEGLSDEEATARLAIFGHNKLEEKSVHLSMTPTVDSRTSVTHQSPNASRTETFSSVSDCRRARFSSFWGLCGTPYRG